MPSGFQIQIPPTSNLHRQEIALRLQQLREYSTTETWFRSVDEIVVYLTEIGVVQKRGLPITKFTIPAWHKRLSFPLFASKMVEGEILCSNLMIQAWLWAHSSWKLAQKYRQHDTTE